MTIQRTILTVDAAVEAVRAGLAAGRAAGVAVSVTVCGPSLEVIAFARADNATPHSAETSRRKAQTSASTRRVTGWMSPALAIELPLASGNILTNIKGGVPVFFGEEFAGAIGIAGGTVDQDAEIAAATLVAIKAQANQ